jgi:hypothetical protein
MSLKHFHILFVTVSTLLAIALAWAEWGNFRAQAGAVHLALAIFCATSAIALTVYGFWFWKKMKKLIL